MVRPAEGFVADDGTFFEQEALCESYEATKNITLAIIETMHQYKVYLPASVETKFISGIILPAMLQNLDLVRRYLNSHSGEVAGLSPDAGADVMADLFAANAERDKADGLGTPLSSDLDEDIPF